MAAHRDSLHYRSGADDLRDHLKLTPRRLRRWSVEAAFWVLLMISWAICLLMVGVVLFRVFVM